MNRKLSTYTCYAIIMLFAATLTVNSLLIPEISKTFSLSISQAGVIFTANFIGFCTFVILGGVAADKWGKKLILSISIVGMALSLIAIPLLQTFFLLCIAITFIGGFGGIIESTISALTAELNPENPSFYVNMSQVFFAIGALIAPVLAGYAVKSGVSWQICFLVLGVLLLVFSIIFILNKLPPLPAPNKITLDGFKNLVTDKKFLLICLCMVFYTGTEVGNWGWMSTFLKENMGFSLSKSSFAIGLFWVAMVVGRFLCGLLTYKFKTRHLVAGLAYLSAAATALSGIMHSEAAVWMAITAIGLTYSSQWPLIVAYGGENYKTFTGTVFALLIASGGLGSTFIPYLMGVVAQNTNIRIAMISPSMLLLAIGLIFNFLERSRVSTADRQPGAPL